MISIAAVDRLDAGLERVRKSAMADAEGMLGVYLHLARASKLRRQPMIQDKLLILAGVRAEEMGLQPISALCRHRILAHNAHHLVGQWPTLAAALADGEFQSYLKQLRRRYSPEKTEHMLDSLGIQLARERESYFSDLEYAASLLDTRPEMIAGILSQEPGPAPGQTNKDANQVSAPAPSSEATSADQPSRRGDDEPSRRRIASLLLVLTVFLAGATVALVVTLWQALFR